MKCNEVPSQKPGEEIRDRIDLGPGVVDRSKLLTFTKIKVGKI